MSPHRYITWVARARCSSAGVLVGMDMTSPAAMRRYLTQAGVPGEAIVEDRRGVDSWASCERAADEFGLDRLLVVSQQFHLPRTVALCRSMGLDVIGVAHDSKESNPPGTRQGYLRRSRHLFRRCCGRYSASCGNLIKCPHRAPASSTSTPTPDEPCECPSAVEERVLQLLSGNEWCSWTTTQRPSSLRSPTVRRRRLSGSSCSSSSVPQRSSA